MEKKILKRIDNIRNNLLHSTDTLMTLGISKEEYDNIVVLKLDTLEKISSVRAEIIKVFKKLETKKENKKD